MTVTIGQSVPPSLANALARVARVSSSNKSGRRVISPAMDLFDPEPGYRGNSTIALFSKAANWLTLHHAGHLSKTAQSACYAERLAELRAGLFPAEYWWTTTPAASWADWGAPWEVLPYEGEINPLYYDPLRMPSKCRIPEQTRYYPLPIGNGTELEPGPGWKGAVISNLYRELYAVRARFWIPMPGGQTRDTLRPAVLSIASSMTATATKRGNKSWFYVVCQSYLRATQGLTGATSVDWHNNWSPHNRRPLTIPDTHIGGWSFTHEQTLITDPVTFARYINKTEINWLELPIWTPTAQGVYFSGNDDVEFHGNHTPTLYTPRTPNE